MAHLFVPQPTMVDLPVFFNVDGVVGAQPAQNNREDVLLVQFAFNVLFKAGRTEFAGVSVTGIIDTPTIQAIRTFQQHFVEKGSHATVDGRVSPAKVGYSYGGGGFWTIVFLNNEIQDRNTSLWPRIDNISGCPVELKAMVKRTVVGT